MGQGHRGRREASLMVDRYLKELILVRPVFIHKSYLVRIYCELISAP